MHFSMEEQKCRELTSPILSDLLKNLETVLFDCDGVLYRGNTVVQGAPEVLKRLQEMGRRIFYVTNNSTKTRRQTAEKCSSMGFPANEENVITSGHVAACYLSEMKRKGDRDVGKIFCVGSESLIEELESAGLSVLKGDQTPQGKGGIQISTNYSPCPDVKCVIVGMDENLTYVKAAKAVRHLASGDCLFVATNTDGSLPVSENVFLPGAGACLAIISTGSGRNPDVVCGKPSRIMFDVAQRKFNINPATTLMVGDRLDTDIAFAYECNLKSLMVLTGVSTVDQAKASDTKPDFILNSLGDMLTLI